MPGMIEKVRDPLLRQTVKNVERSLNPRTRGSYDSTVSAGMTLMWSQKFDQERESFLAMIKGPDDVPRIVAKGIVKVISIIQNEIKNAKEPIPAAVPAALVLMCQILEYVEKKRGIDITPNIVDRTTHLVNQGIFALYNITPEVIQAIQSRKKGGAPQAQPNAQTEAPPAPPTQPPAAPAGA